MSEPLGVVDEAETRLRPLEVAAAHAWWAVNTDASEENERRRVETEIARAELLGDPELFARIRDARGRTDDPLVRRQLDVLHDGFLSHQVPKVLRERIIELEASVEARYAQHRGIVGGEAVSDNAIRAILRSSDDPVLRREAWEASKTIGSVVAEDVRSLAHLRNEAARLLGFRDWFALSVATSELDEARLFETLDEADRVTAEPYARWKTELDDRLAARFGCAPSDLRPWHYDDPFFQELPVEGGIDLDPVFAGRDLLELTRRTYDGLEVETREILGRSDLFPRERKCQHAFCMDVDRQGDIRVLANVTDNAYWMDTMLHELGHGIYDAGIDRELPWLLRSVHLVPTEGIAILFGRLHGDADWLSAVAEMDRGDVKALARQLHASRAADLLIFTRWVLVMTNFERALYAEPDGDHDTTWWQLVRRYQLLTPPDDRSGPDWAAKIHVAVVPVYYHNYLYGHMVASQLRDALEREMGGLVDRPGAGRFLAQRVFRHGLAVRWDQLVEQVTGAPLGVAALARDIAVAA